MSTNTNSAPAKQNAPTKKIRPSDDPSKPFYHELTCECGKYSCIDDFKEEKKQQIEKAKEQECDQCHTTLRYLKVLTCRCGNCTGVSCYDPNENCDICNGSMDIISEEDNNSEEFLSMINEFKEKRNFRLLLESLTK